MDTLLHCWGSPIIKAITGTLSGDTARDSPARAMTKHRCSLPRNGRGQRGDDFGTSRWYGRADRRRQSGLSHRSGRISIANKLSHELSGYLCIKNKSNTCTAELYATHSVFLAYLFPLQIEIYVVLNISEVGYILACRAIIISH